MHGDYSPYNVMASPRDTRRLAAVVDWDTGTVDGPDEVHRWRIGRNVLAAQRKSGTTAAAAGGDLF
jgi:aminoglycoside phosphotransferase (APT) family kinase protein